MADEMEKVTDKARDDVEETTSEERAREDEVTYYDDSKVLDAIGGLSEKLDGLRDMVSAFVDAGGVISEGAPESTDEDVDVVLYDEDIPDEIDEDVIRDIANVEFSDEVKDED